MKSITLPEELNLESTQSVQVFDYHSTQPIVKQQIILNQNAFSFLMEGTKEVFFDTTTISIDNTRFLIMGAGHCLMTEKLSDVKSYRSVLLFFTNEALLKFMRKAAPGKTVSAGYKTVYDFQYDHFILGFVKVYLIFLSFQNTCKQNCSK